MAYPKELYIRANRILEQRRENSAAQTDSRIQEILAKVPEIDEIQSKLSKIGFEISKIILFQGNTETKINDLKVKSKALVAERTALLEKNGYSENALQPEYFCSACNDKGFINGRMCNCHRQLLKEIMRDEINKVAPIESCTFETFSLDMYSSDPMDNAVVPRNKAEIIFTNARNFANNFPNRSKNILFMGGTGLGKTHLSLAIANSVVNRGYYVCYGTSQNICDDLKAEQYGRTEGLTYTKQQILECDLLVIDDLGTEMNNTQNTATIYNIINSRILSNKITVISTNFVFNELLDRYDQRITSRITGEYVRFEFVGQDIRNI